MCALNVMCWKHEIKMLHMACGLFIAFIWWQAVGVCTCAMVQMWRSEHSLLEPILVYHVGIRDQTQDVRLGGKLLTH